MITLTRYPKENRVLLNANPCLIKATTTNGSTHYFRVEIRVNDGAPIIESWSKLNNELQIDFRNYYKNRFADILPEFDLDGFKKLDSLIIKINITIKEYLLADDSLVESVDLPVFYFLQGFNQADFDDTLDFQFASGQLAYHLVTPNSKIAFALYKSTTSDLAYALEKPDGTVLKSATLSAASFGIYIAQIDLAGLDLSETNYLKIGNGSTNYGQIILKNLGKTFYRETHLYYKTNNGLFLSASLFGQSEFSYAHEKEEYKLIDNSFKTFSVTTETSLKVNTGHLYEKQLPLIRSINEALQVYVKIKGTYKKVQVTGRKSPGAVDREYLYNDTIEFVFQNDTTTDNTEKFIEV